MSKFDLKDKPILEYVNISDPFPHFVGKFNEEIYNYAVKLFESQNFENYERNRCNVLCKDDELFTIINHVLQEKFFKNCILSNIFSNEYPKLFDKEISDDTDLTFRTRILYSQNPPSTTGYKIRDWHLDTGDKYMIGLWYLKHPEEDNDGGNLKLLNPKTNEMVEIKYEENLFVVFPNLTSSWHAITPRNASKYPRRYINFLFENVDLSKKLHNYERSGPAEFRGKLINYYK